MSVKGRVRAERTLDAHSAALKVRKATGVGVGLGGEPQPRTGTLSGLAFGFDVEGFGKQSAQASGIVTREGRNRQIAVSEASRARPDAQRNQSTGDRMMAKNIIAVLLVLSGLSVLSGLVIWVGDAFLLACYFLLCTALIWAASKVWEFVTGGFDE